MVTRVLSRPTLLAEETRRADVIAPYAIIWSVVTSAVLGMGFLLVVLFCIQVCSRPLLNVSNMQKLLVMYAQTDHKVFHEIFYFFIITCSFQPQRTRRVLDNTAPHISYLICQIACAAHSTKESDLADSQMISFFPLGVMTLRHGRASCVNKESNLLYS